MKKLKWLDMLIGSPSFSDEFLIEFDLQMKPQFERFFSKAMNWNRLWFYVEPIDRNLVFSNELSNEGRKRTQLFTSEIRCGQMGIPCKIYWESITEDRYVHSSEKIKQGEIKIVLESAEESYWKHRFPGIDDKLSLNILDFVTVFPVVMEGPQFSHEGYYEVLVDDSQPLIDIEKSFSQSISQWNDPGFGIAETPKHRGLFHELYMDYQEDGKYKFYFDSGSSIEGAHKYFIEQLSKEVKGILKIVIRPNLI